MSAIGHTEDTIVRRGQAAYEQKIRPHLDEAANKGKMLFINGETGEFEMDADDVAAPLCSLFGSATRRSHASS